MSGKRKASGAESAFAGNGAHASGSPASSKRVKFGSGGDDAVDSLGHDDGDLDLDEQDRKRNQQGRKGRLVTDGYASGDSVDSELDEAEMEDDDDEGVGRKGARATAIERQRGESDEEDDDMFAEPGAGKKSKEGDAQRGAGKKFLSLGDIEGQEFGTGDRVSDEEDADPELELEDEEADSDDDEAAAAERTPPTSPGGTVQRREKRERSKAGMGFTLDGFNMKAEMQQGRFDDQGNYTANAADPHAEHDVWLQGHYSRKGIRAAREAKARREKEDNERRKRAEEEALGEEESKRELCLLMEPGETVLEALQRFGAQAKKKQKPKAGARRARNEASAGAEDTPMDAASSSKNGAASTESSADAAAAEAAGDALAKVTSLASSLMSRFSLLDIYDETYEALLRSVRRSQLEGADWDPSRARRAAAAAAAEAASEAASAPLDERSFVYRWAPAYLAATSAAPAPDVEVFGPYPAADLKEWAASGYFGEERERILLREQGAAGPWQEWKGVFAGESP
jgi:CD2 antigen cytoplasmic tail-binding protein 2